MHAHRTAFPNGVDAYIESFASCVISDALKSATPACLERRAADLESALPRAGDFLGNSTPAQRAARRMGLESKITAYRNAAAFWRHLASGEPLHATPSPDRRIQGAAA